MKTQSATLFFILIVLNISAQNYINPYTSNFNSTPQFVYCNDYNYHIGDSISERTIQIFRNADRNSDGKISVGELQSFQNWLKNSFKYKSNSTALHPDDFIKQGGGDCEDFAIMTTCMLNYHGVVAYVAGFGRVTVNKHAVCIVQVTSDKVPGYIYYTLSGWGIPSGIYIPVDYEKVGGLSAIDRRWKIARINKPASIYGWNM